MPTERTAVGTVADFPEDTMKPVQIDDREVLIIRQHGRFYALPNQCTHARYPLHDGELLDGKIKCQYHGATFDLETGRPTLPAVKRITLYSVSVEDETVYVQLTSH
jgi:3-phenylpropionate/trans-cinnamate dioxygenase ferredoxin subunit